MTGSRKTLQELRKEAIKHLLKEYNRSGRLENGAIETALQTLITDTFGRLDASVRRVIELEEKAEAADKLEATQALRGDEHLRFEPITTITSAKQFDPETVFEKALAREVSPLPPGGLTPGSETPRWANQIPIWSGICGPDDRGGRKANIDIGYSPEHGAFLLYELKIISNCPLYAILELITYAIGYLVLRKLTALLPDQAKKIQKHDHGLLSADSITFSVIAPGDYYERKAGGKIVLTKGELENIKQIAKKLLQRQVECLRVGKLQIDISLLQLACAKPGPFDKDARLRDEWLAGMGALRDLVLNAKPISQLES